ncbi:MAG TPA: hypothetical protein VJT82_12540 [Pyrinomonadaceae bacterium]|nr:hypothetical protein [Pyrinomonadaceae bacterium]
MSTLPGGRAKQGKRSRIVVNVEPPPPEDKRGAVERWRGTFRARRVAGRRRRLASLAAIVVAGIVLLIFAGGYAWWRSFQSSPSYALALAVDAAERDDQQTFDQLVDTEQVSRSLVPQVIERMNGRDGSLNIPPQVRRQIASNAQVWLPGLREQVRGVLMSETKTLAEKRGAASYPFFIRAFALSRLGESAKQGEGNDATATVTYKFNEQPVEFDLKGSDAAGQPAWRVVAVKSDELASRVAAQVAKTFPMMGR